MDFVKIMAKMVAENKKGVKPFSVLSARVPRFAFEFQELRVRVDDVSFAAF
jgi:hypothetical protein